MKKIIYLELFHLFNNKF